MDPIDKICRNFINNPSIDPFSGKTIEIHGPTYNKLMKLCEDNDYTEKTQKLFNDLKSEEEIGIIKNKDIDKYMLSFMDYSEIIKLLKADSRMRNIIYDEIPYIMHKPKLDIFISDIYNLDEMTLFNKIVIELIKNNKDFINIIKLLSEKYYILHEIIKIFVSNSDNINNFKGDDLNDLIAISNYDSKLFVYIQTINLTYKQQLKIKNLFNSTSGITINEPQIDYLKGLYLVNYTLFQKQLDYIIDNEHIIIGLNDEDLKELIKLSTNYPELYIKIYNLIPVIIQNKINDYKNRIVNDHEEIYNLLNELVFFSIDILIENSYIAKNIIKTIDNEIKSYKNLHIYEDFYKYLEQFIFLNNYDNTYIVIKSYLLMLPDYIDKDEIFLGASITINNYINDEFNTENDIIDYIRQLVRIAIDLTDLNLFFVITNNTLDLCDTSKDVRNIIDEGLTFFES